jgi:hypothetical protein
MSILASMLISLLAMVITVIIFQRIGKNDREFLERMHEQRIEEMEDMEYKHQMDIRKNRTKNFFNVVGEKATEQIEWILENGMDEFYKAHESIVDNGESYFKSEERKAISETIEKEVKQLNKKSLTYVSVHNQAISRPNYVVSCERIEFRGGKGNRKLLAYDYKTEYHD